MPATEPVHRASAFWVAGQRSGELRAEDLPMLKPGFVRVKTLYSAVSRGTEALVFHGRVPESEYQRMRCPHQAGSFPWPVKYGYSSVGRVVEGSEHLLDKIVFCLYPHQTQYIVPETSVSVVPEDVPPERAVLAANMETALNAIWDAQLTIGDRVSIVGGGTIGCLCAYLARHFLAADVELIDIEPDRAPLAEALGVHFANPKEASSERDVVFHASASEAGLATALGILGREGVVIELSWYGTKSVSLPLGRDFHVKRVTLRSSQVGTVSPLARRRYNHVSRLELAVRLCVDPRLSVLISGQSDFHALPETMPQLFSSESRALCHRVRYPD